MDSNNDYIEDNDEGLTLKKIGHFFKKSWLVILISMIVSVIVASIIALPIKFFYKSEPVARTSIEFVYKGIEKGEDPQGGRFNADNIISANVLSNAVAMAGLGEVITEINTLRGAIRVEAVSTDEYIRLLKQAAEGNATAQNTLRNYTMYPTKFNIVISNPEEIGLTDSQAVILLDKIVAAYYKDFSSRFALKAPFDDYKYNLSAQTTFDFADAYNLYSARLEVISDYITSLSNEMPQSFSSAYASKLDQLRNELSLVHASYSKFNTYILVNSIWRDRDAAKISLSASKSTYEGEKEAKEAYRTKLEDQIKLFQPNTDEITSPSGSVTVTQTYPDEYYVYHRQLDTTNRALETLSNQIANITAHLERLNATTGATEQSLIDNAQSMLEDIEEQSVTLIDNVGNAVDEYNNSMFIASSVSQIQPSVVTRNTLSFSLIVVYIITLLAGFLLGCIIGGIMIYKNNRAKAVRKPVDSSEEQTQN